MYKYTGGKGGDGGGGRRGKGGGGGGGGEGGLGVAAEPRPLITIRVRLREVWNKNN